MLMGLPSSQGPRPSISFLEYVYGERGDRRSIVGRAAMGGDGDLREARLSAGDEEVRVWEGFGPTYLQGTILRKRAGVWTTVRLLSATPGTPKKGWTKAYPAPNDGWPTFWKRAEALGIWTLPDDATLPQKDRKTVFDGFSYVVETLRNGKYRAYAYDNPDLQTQWPEAKSMVAIGRLLDVEFPRPNLP